MALLCGSGGGGGGRMTGSVTCTRCPYKCKLLLSTASATEIVSKNVVGRDHQFVMVEGSLHVVVVVSCCTCIL